MKLLYLITFSVLIGNTIQAQTLHIYGGDNRSVYLGCLNCNKYDSKSIWNAYGTHGLKYNSKSIWNEYGTYGGKYSRHSPFNAYADNPPALVDNNGNFYGYFTVRSYYQQRAEFSLVMTIYQYWEFIKEDVGAWYDKLF